jgi:protein TonB
VLAELERTEQEESERTEAKKRQNSAPDKPAKNAAPKDSTLMSGVAAYSSRHRQKKTRGSVVALLVLILVVCGFYAAWMYQPGFQAIAQPKIDYVLALAGAALPATPSHNPAKPPTQPAPAAAPAPVSALPANPNNTPAEPSDSTTASPIVSTIKLTTVPASGGTAPSAATGTHVPLSATPSRAIAPLAAGNTIGAAPSATKGANKFDTKKDAAPEAPSTAPLRGEDSALVLSSKGAEKRLTYSIAPKYPVEALPGKTEATVILKAIVDESGKIDGVRLVEGNATLAPAAIEAVKQWRYRPYLRDGKPQSFQTVVIVDFQR